MSLFPRSYLKIRILHSCHLSRIHRRYPMSQILHWYLMILQHLKFRWYLQSLTCHWYQQHLKSRTYLRHLKFLKFLNRPMYRLSPKHQRSPSFHCHHSFQTSH
jgi:hypothetical protein